MTLDEARAMLARPEQERRVVYENSSWHGYKDRGVVTAVTGQFVFVRYGNQPTATATYPEDLTAVP
jgi:hypothetical protein